MQIKSLISRLYIVLGLVIAAMLPAQAVRMKLHPGFDADPVRIIDTGRGTYFHVLQRPFDTGQGCYNTPLGAIFYYDRSRPEAGIRPLAETSPASGINAIGAEYSPEGEFLAILYSDLTLDFIHDSGKVVSSDALKGLTGPKSDQCRALTVAGNTVWVSTGGGYAAFDGLSGRLLKRADMRNEFSGICLVGDLGLAIIDGRLKSFLPDFGMPGRAEGFRDITHPDTPKDPLLLMPMKGNEVAVMWRPDPNGPYRVSSVMKNGDEIIITPLTDIWLDVSAVQSRLVNPLEYNCIRNHAGWLVYSPVDARQIKSEGAYSPASVSSIGFSRTLTRFGSHDMQTGWAYKDRGEFAPARLEGGIFLIDDEASIRPAAPDIAESSHMVYVAGRGVIATNFGYSVVFPNFTTTITSAHLSLREADGWRRLSSTVNAPYAAETPGPAQNLYNNRKSRFPMDPSTGLTADPINPDFLWISSTFGGFAAIDISDPKQNPVHFTGPNDPFATFPGTAANFVEESKAWKGFYCLSNPTFDGDGTLWTARYRIDAVYENMKDAVRLYHIPADKRREALENHDAVKAGAPTSYISIDALVELGPQVKCLALANPANRNKLLVYLPEIYRTLVRVDHAGTPDDPSDDMQERICYITDQHGGEWYVQDANHIIEDPLTGEVWVATGQALVAFDPNGEIVNTRIPGRVLDITDGGYAGNIMANVPTRYLAFDEYGRLWISTLQGGLWCVSADRTKVEAHYTTLNSDLPSDTSFGMVWNPQTKSLMVSTPEGLAEIFPDLPSEPDPMRMPVVAPEAVMPQHAGGVEITALPSYAEVTVKDAKGNECRRIYADAEGRALWDLRDNEGVPVRSGHYTLSGNFVEVTVPVIR